MSGSRDAGGAGGADERIATGDGAPVPAGLIGPGGKVDAEAIRRLYESDGGEGGEAGEESAVRTVTFTLQRDLKKRLDKYLTDRITFMSRNQLQRLIEGGGVLVNDRPAKPSTNLRIGDVVEVTVPPPPPTGIQPEDIPLEVLYEDEHLIVVNKSPDIIVHPARSHLKGTMVNALAGRFRASASGSLSSVGGEFARPGVVHRLDRNTSGVIVFAKSDEAHWKLGRQFEHRRVDKRYLAVVHGRVEPDVDVIDLPIGPHPSREKGYREKYVVRHDELGKPSVTIYRVREGYWGSGEGGGEERDTRRGSGGGMGVAPGWKPSAASSLRGSAASSAASGDRCSLVELELKTGRTHQIRVHLSHLGYPIVGDDMYGGRAFVGADGATIIDRQALHAAVLGFTHPISGERMEFTAPLRGDMAALVRELRRRSGERLERPAAPGATVDLGRAMGA